MKRYFYLTFLLFTFCTLINAQQGDIIADLNSEKPSQGRVMIFQDEAIEGLLGSKINPNSSQYPFDDNTNGYTSNGNNENNGENSYRQPSTYVQTRGYKIQVFSGNNQRTSKSEAFSRKAMIDRSFPDMDTVVTFDSPVWRLRVGNFKTREQAAQAMDELKSAFPSFSKEMQIVQSIVKVPVY